jgi:hypothetical protein
LAQLDNINLCFTIYRPQPADKDMAPAQHHRWEYEVPVAALIASSVKAWRRIVEEGREWTLIVEDDVM